jgi:hypothetical protein
VKDSDGAHYCNPYCLPRNLGYGRKTDFGEFYFYEVG